MRVAYGIGVENCSKGFSTGNFSVAGLPSRRGAVASFATFFNFAARPWGDSFVVHFPTMTPSTSSADQESTRVTLVGRFNSSACSWRLR